MGWPKMAFIEKRLAGDPTNWWAPNHAAIAAMLRTTGLAVAAQPAHEIYVSANRCIRETMTPRNWRRPPGAVGEAEQRRNHPGDRLPTRGKPWRWGAGAS